MTDPSQTPKRKLDEPLVSRSSSIRQRMSQGAFSSRNSAITANTPPVSPSTSGSSPSRSKPLTKLNDLEISKTEPEFAVVFRVTLVGDTTRPNYFKWHAYDGTAEVVVVCFGSQSINAAGLIKINQIYRLEGFKVEDNPAKFRSLPDRELRISLSRNADITTLSEAENIPHIPFSFTPLKKLQSELNVGSNIDVLAVVEKIWPIEQSSRGDTMRDILLVDGDQTEVIIRLYKNVAETFICPNGTTVAIRDAVLKEYDGIRTLTSVARTLIWQNPELDDDSQKIALESAMERLFPGGFPHD